MQYIVEGGEWILTVWKSILKEFNICVAVLENPHCGNNLLPFIKSKTGWFSMRASIRSLVASDVSWRKSSDMNKWEDGILLVDDDVAGPSITDDDVVVIKAQTDGVKLIRVPVHIKEKSRNRLEIMFVVDLKKHRAYNVYSSCSVLVLSDEAA
jgi:hypothetical protein